MESFYKFDGDDLVLNVLGTPGAKQDKILSARGNQLKISVKAAPEQGKATEYMIKFLTKVFGVKKSDIVLLYGQTTLSKQFRIKSPKKLPPVIQALEDEKCDS